MRTTTLLVAAGTALTLAAPGLAGDGDAHTAAALAADAAARTALAIPQAEKFTVNVTGQIQFRSIWNQRADNLVEEDTTLGFQTRRTKLEVGGKIISDAWGYKVVGAFERDGGAFVLEDAFGSYKLNDSWTLMWGQFKLPFMREESLSSKYQLAADRSVMNEVFNQDRSQGIQAGFQSETLRFAGAFSDGFNTDNTDFTSGMEADFAGTARLEWKWAGDWKQFGDFTNFRGGKYGFGGMAGGAVHWQSGGETGGTADMDMFSATADVGVEGDGWNAFAAVVYRNIEPAGGSDLTDWGAMAQGGIFVSPQTELFGRFDMIFPDSDRAGDDEFSTLTLGLNHYFAPESHAAKFTVDLQYFMDTPTDSLMPSGSTGRGIGLLTDDTDDGQWAVRAQMQILF